ncbi:unnamed protein product [Prorocentrum cordatum]|uniref:FACT complex subunit n=1 Tax=Prorocentrum cordatum TaxID=2364126 RepID=A0ABN9PPT2_9DINO|nr:unnamed protein product [Polarella glacialis]
MPVGCEPCLLPAEERRRRMSRTQKDVVNQIRTQAGEKNPSSSSRKKPEPHTPADITLASVISAMQARTGIRTPLEPAELKALGEPLKTAMATYKKAQVLCSRAPGYETLSHRPSLVLFQDDLVPEVHAVGSCVEPDPIRQVEHDMSALMATAELAQRQLLQKLQLDGLEDAEEFPLGVIEAQSMAVPMAQFIYNPGPKKQERAETKAFVRYAPSAGQKQYQHLLDLARATLVFENCETLMAGLQAMLESDLYDILEVRNHFTTPLRTGRRYVDVLVTVDVPLPHVCELRFEEVHFQKATFRAQQHLEEFLDALCTIYSKRSSVRPDYLHYLAESVLASAPDPGSLRKFRCFFAKSFGTSVCGWRSKFGSCGRNLQFQAFRQACCALKHREHTTGYWMAMDAGRANTVSLFELDPEAVVLLTRVRSRLLTLVDSRVPEVVRADAIYVKLKERSPPSAPLGLNEFRAGAKPLGVSPAEADRAFAYLDAKGGGPMASLTVADINWLLNLPSMVYLEAACLGQTDFAVDERLSSPPQRPRAQQGLRPEASAAGCAPAGAGAGVAAAGLASAGLAGAGALSCQEDAEEAAHEDEGGEQEYAADKGEPQEEEQEEAAVDQGEAQEEEQEEGDDAADKGEAQEEAQEAAEEDEDEEEGEEVEEESGEEEAEEADGHAAADAGEDEEECTF